jgi:hypothetical protein
MSNNNTKIGKFATPLEDSGFGDSFYEVSIGQRRWVRLTIKHYQDTGRYVFIKLFRNSMRGGEEPLYTKDQHIGLTESEWKELLILGHNLQFTDEPTTTTPGGAAVSVKRRISDGVGGGGSFSIPRTTSSSALSTMTTPIMTQPAAAAIPSAPFKHQTTARRLAMPLRCVENVIPMNHFDTPMFEQATVTVVGEDETMRAPSGTGWTRAVLTNAPTSTVDLSDENSQFLCCGFDDDDDSYVEESQVPPGWTYKPL